MKRILPILLACLLLSGCGPSLQVRYERAQLYLGAGDQATAARLFDQLGEYADSADYAAYCRALYALDRGEYALARAGFAELGSFRSSARYLRYAEALAAPPEESLALLGTLGTFADCAERAARLRTELPQTAVQAARLMMEHAAWDQALEVLSPYRWDAEADALAGLCENAVYDAAEQRFAAASLADAADLIERYTLAGSHPGSADRLESLRERFGPSLALLACAAQHPHVCCASYPIDESGVPSPVCWQVLRVEGQTLTLLACQVLDAGNDALPALAQASLPTAADLTVIPVDMRRCGATAYALANGVAEEDGRAAWCLADSTANGRRLAVGADGQVYAADPEDAFGVRPVLVIPLEALALTGGSGTAEDPFS